MLVVRAADHVGDAHVDVVDHDGEVIERRAVAAADDHVADLAGVLSARTEDQVVPAEIRVVSGTRSRTACGAAVGPEIQVPAAPVVGPLAAGRDRRLAALLELCLGVQTQR